MQQGSEMLLPSLIKLFRATFAHGYIPQVWRGVKVVFIPMAGNDLADIPKSYCAISLHLFIGISLLIKLANLEKLATKKHGIADEDSKAR